MLCWILGVDKISKVILCRNFWVDRNGMVILCRIFWVDKLNFSGDIYRGGPAGPDRAFTGRLFLENAKTPPPLKMLIHRLNTAFIISYITKY